MKWKKTNTKKQGKKEINKKQRNKPNNNRKQLHTEKQSNNNKLQKA